MFVMQYCIPLFEIKSRVVANNILPILWNGFIIINMDKLKRFVKHLFAPAIVLVLVAIMGIFSPVVSVAAALRVNLMADPTDGNILDDVKIQNLPSRNVKVGESITAPTFTAGLIEVCHAGKVAVVADGSSYTYGEVGQYEWRFSVGGVLINKHMVNVTDTIYSMTMPENIVTVAPKDLETLKLPLPAAYKVDGEKIEVATIVKGDNNGILDGKYVKITDAADKVYTLNAVVTLENRKVSDFTIDENGLQITVPDETGNLKVAYQLNNEDGSKLLTILTLNNIEIKNVNKNEVTFANIPTAPSVKSLAYYTNVSLTAPTADSAKVGTTSFNVEAQTKIFKVQCSPYATEPSDWSKDSDKIHNLIVKNQDGKWIVENEKDGVATDEYLEIDGLNVKVKKLGWYRFQFETTTLFGYQLSDEVKVEDLNIEQDNAKNYVRYWSNSIHISNDQTAPTFIWVNEYDADNEAAIREMNENYSELLNQYKNALPMTDKADSKKVTINKEQGLVLPAIFPHDNANSYQNLSVSSVIVKQIQDEDGETVSNNSVTSGNSNTNSSFVYKMDDPLKISFVENNATSNENNPVLLNQDGLYQISITVKEANANYADGKVGGYARSKTQNYYFYLDNDFECAVGDQNSPVVDADQKFQVSDVYLWEGSTFEFKKPNFSDAHTATDKIQIDYYLVGFGATEDKVLSKLDATANVLSVKVDLDNLYAYDEDSNENSNTLLTSTDYDKYEKFYIYAVARNFNAMQTNLKNDLKVASISGDKIFDTSLCIGAYKSDAALAQYGYAWKRAEFKINEESDANSAELTTTFGTNSYKAGKTVHIASVNATWDAAAVVDGQMSVAVYQVKDGAMIPVNVVDSDKTSSADVVSSVAFFRNAYTMENLYFTPGDSGKYILIVTAKDHASAQISTSVTEIQIDAKDAWSATQMSVKATASGSVSIDETMIAGETLVLPNFKVGPNQEYVAKNRVIYDGDTQIGDYTITVLGVNDPNCITGNKFTPNKAGQYTLRHSYYLNGDPDAIFTQDYIIQVTENTGAVSNIRMGEDYKANKVLWSDSVTPDAVEGAGKQKIGNEYYTIGENDTGTNKKPAFAITLNEFIMSNYGAATDFVVDSAALYEYLEPIYENGEVTGYMYPAIAIPMANLISDNYSSDEVEITVQKSGNSNYLVSSKKKNAGGSIDKASVIDSIDGYFVFRPEGKFRVECKDQNKFNASNYLEATNSPSGAAGVYTVSYKTQSTELSFNVTFGNLQNGTLSWNKDFLTYNNDDGKGNQEINSDNSKDVVIEIVDGHRYVTIDMSKLYFTGNADMQALIAKGPNEDEQQYADDQLATAYFWENARVSVSFEGGAFIDSSDWSDAEDETEAIKINEDGKFMYKFDLSKGSGTYKVNVSLPNKYTATPVSASIEFTIDVDVTNRNHNLNNVWGIILIVLSLGLLAGVIYYFVKTSRATRFVDTPRALKGKEKNKASKEKAPKVEAPKEDVK